MVIMASSSDNDAGGPGWSRPNGAAHSIEPAELVPQNVLSDNSLVQDVIGFSFESSDDDSGSPDLKYLESIRSQRLRRRTDAWAYPGDQLRSIEGKQVNESNNWLSLPPDEFDRRLVAEFRMTETVFLELLELVTPHL
jgi:hypothetical protein